MKNRIVESLGKNNKSFLRTTFGFKTITQAKKALGATTKQEAYDIMKELYNDKIEEERKVKQKARNEMNKKIRKQTLSAKMKFLNVLEQLNERKRSFNVAITINERQVYRDSNKSYLITNSFERTYIARNETELENKINEEVVSLYPLNDSIKVIELVSYHYTISQEKLHKVNPLDVPMKRGKPLKASFLQYGDKIDPISYEEHGGECVLKTLLKYMDIKKEKTLVKYFDEASNELYGKPYHKNNGITSRMILHLCQKRNISCLGFDQKNKNFVKHTADQKFKRKFRPIIFYMFLSHFYLITDEKTVVSISQTFRQNNNVFQSSLEIAEDKKDREEIRFYSNLPISECLTLEKNATVIYDQNDLNEELKEYIKLANDIPKVVNKSITQVGKILLNNNVQLVVSGCLGEGLDWKSLQSVCEKAEIPFNNQSIGQLLCQLRDKFFVVKRAKFTTELREEIKHQQEGQCIMCKEMLGDKFHIDHIKPLANGGTNDKNNLQALCQSCHIDKSREEKDAGEYIQNDNLTSAFNMQAMKVIESNWFRKVAFTQKLVHYEGDLDHLKQCYDMVKCRRNILLHYGEDFCRYSVLDDIEIFDGKLTTGFYYVETYNDFPLRQNGFYSLPMVKYCLEQDIISMEDIKYQLKPSFKIESDYFKSFVEHLDNLFAGDDFLKKLSVNSLVGLFGRRKSTFVENMICDKNELDDIACAYQNFYRPYLNEISEEIVQVAGQNEIRKIESTFPLHAQILDCEAVELHKLVNLIKKHGGTPYEVKTDAVNYYCSHPLNIGEHFWDSEKTVKKYKTEEAKDILRAVILDNVEKFELSGSYYKKYSEDSDYTKLAKMLVDSEKGCLILGPAGTGKTFLINEIKKHLEAKDLKYKCLAPTNKATLLMNGETLHKFSYALLNSKKQLKKYKNIDCIMVDEISMVQEIFYQVLMILKNYNPNLKLFIVGDFGQLPPVNDKVNKNYEMSRALFELVDGNKLELTQCKRSDDSHFNTCMKVRKGIPIDFKPFQQKEKTYLNVCFTNELRKKINSECAERFLEEQKPNKIVKYEALKHDKNSQDMTICKGMPIIARINNKSFDVINNEVFTVDKIDDEFITISNELKDSKQIPSNQFNKMFYLAFCITIHKSQGTTFDKKYTIYEWSKQNRKLKYVALSRATDAKNIQIVL